ncbi:MAG: hypothetical protein HN692_04095, partial [Candidatus Cloacimonetes bacterium]|nr:hypothetical protein [Candidatus Cloacimonadota bacterium]
KMKKLFLLVLVSLVVFVFATEKMVIRFENPSASLVKEFQNYDVAAFKPNIFLDIVVSEIEREKLANKGYNFTVTQTENQLKTNLGNVRDLAGYRTYEETLSELQQIEMQYPNICKLYDVGETWGKEYSNAGNSYYDDYHHEVWALKISDNVNSEEDEPNVYLMGEHHAREPISLEVVMSDLYHILNNYGSDPTITQNVNNTQIWVIPLVNPNGHKIVTDETDVWWRKNIRDNNLDGNFDTDYNSGYGVDGVDPNRNYGWEWGAVGTSDDFSSPVYHGPNEWSEPEIYAMQQLIESHHFVAGITYHSYSELVLFPFGYNEGVVAPDHDALEELAVEMANTLPAESGGYYTPQESWQLYPCMGTTDDYSYGEYGIFSYTIEIGTEFIPPANQVDGICADHIEAAMIMLNRVHQSTLTGQITDAETGEPIVAEIYVDGIDNTGVFRNPYISDVEFGRYYRLLQDGNYDVTFSAYGYETVTLNNVNINSVGQTIGNVELAPVTACSFSGIIKNGETLLPLENVNVEIQNSPVDPTTTDENGEFYFPTIFSGTYDVRFSKNGYSSVVQEVTLVDGTNDILVYLYESSAESFEDGFSTDWNFSGNANWTIDNFFSYDGSYSAKSGDIGEWENTSLSITMEAVSDGEITFWQKISTEANYDFFKFYIDGVLQESWAGEIAWTEEVFSVQAGTHTYKWEYNKDGYVDVGGDCVWIDYITFPPTEIPDPPVVYGDVDGNSEIQAYDASLTLQNVVGLVDFTELQITAADVDGNGQIQAYDASLILQFVVGIIDEFPVER